MSTSAYLSTEVSRGLVEEPGAQGRGTVEEGVTGHLQISTLEEVGTEGAGVLGTTDVSMSISASSHGAGRDLVEAGGSRDLPNSALEDAGVKG